MPSLDPLPPLELQPGEIHLWFVFPDAIQDPELLERYGTLLTSEEQERQQRFYFEKHRHQYLLTRALVRTTLSRYVAFPPDQWRFSKNEYGRPEAILSAEMPPLRFNLSHADGLIACGVTLARDLGVDVENADRKSETVKIANRFFSAQEVQDLHKLPSQDQKGRFFDYWTLKESYIKARGMGLSLPLEQFTFHLSEQEPVRISFDPRLEDVPEDWQFWLFQPTPHHKGAVAIRRGTQPHYQLVINKVVPLIEEQPFQVIPLSVY